MANESMLQLGQSPCLVVGRILENLFTSRGLQWQWHCELFFLLGGSLLTVFGPTRNDLHPFQT